jgi:hypothetical protein
MRELVFLCLLSIISASCVGTGNLRSEIEVPTPSASPSSTPQPTIALDKIDLSQIGPLGGKGRAQDPDYHKDLPVVRQLLSHGKEAIPFLISKLDDETKINYQIVDYWNDAYVGDVALVLLSDFFLESDGATSTIKGMDWDTFLGRKSNEEMTGEALLRRYVKKNGRKNIKQRWQKVWDQNKDRIYWNAKDLNFDLEEK